MYSPRPCSRSKATRRLLILAFLLTPPFVGAAVLPASTHLEVSLSEASGSRISRAGDVINATVIAPVFAQGLLMIPQGATVSGTLDEVDRLGYGLKHVTSEMKYRFNSLHLPNGTVVPIDATVLQVEEAKERVSSEGAVGGIYPTANLSSTVASYVMPLLWIDPHFGLPFLGIKVMIARSPDPEIYFPAATEFILRLTEPVSLPSTGPVQDAIPGLSPEDMAHVQALLAKLPQQRTNRGRNHPSDLVNLLFLGSRESIQQAFRAAGWAGAQQGTSLMAIYRMYHCMVQRVGYRMAPMGQLTLNGHKSDEEFQKSLDTFSRRHHVRLWKQGEEEAWLSSATEDIGYGVRNMHLTHATDAAIDNERNKVLNDVAFSGCVSSATLLPRAMADEQESSIKTDGRLAVIRLNECRRPRTMFNESSGVPPRPRRHSLDALVALRNDLIRTNPIFLAYNSVKLLCTRGASRSNAAAQLFRSKRDKEGSSASSLQNAWIRPTVLDTTHLN